MFKILVLVLIISIDHSNGRTVETSLLSNANNHLGLGLLKHLYSDQKNVFLSPFSISTAFAMLYSGAKGKTAEEMRDVLGYDVCNITDSEINQLFSETLKSMEELDKSKYELNVANRLVVQKGFQILETFKQNLQKYFDSSIESVDFTENSDEVLKSINQWVSRQTNDKIKELLSEPLDPMTRLVILSVIYFKGVFQTKFDKNKTVGQVFFNSGDNEKTTQMMKRTGKFNFTEVPEIDSNLLEIPYSGDDISLYIVLPNQRRGLKRLITQLNAWNQIENSIRQLREEEVEVMVPKFKIETSYSLNEQLSAMGMKTVFTSSADLSAIDGKHDLFVSNVFHKAFIEVSEEGTEAAAATAIRMLVSYPPKVFLPRYFRADHPFLLLIRNNKNGMILFSGYINQL